VRGLAERVRDEISTRYGVTLEFEIEFLGDWSGWQPS